MSLDMTQKASKPDQRLKLEQLARSQFKVLVKCTAIFAVTGQSWTEVSNLKFAAAELSVKFETGSYWLKAAKCPGEVVSTLSSLAKVASANILVAGGRKGREALTPYEYFHVLTTQVGYIVSLFNHSVQTPYEKIELE